MILASKKHRNNKPSQQAQFSEFYNQQSILERTIYTRCVPILTRGSTSINLCSNRCILETNAASTT